MRGSDLPLRGGALGLRFCPSALAGPFSWAIVGPYPWPLVGPLPWALVGPIQWALDGRFPRGPRWTLGHCWALPLGSCWVLPLGP